MTDFGITFKTARESKGLSLEQIATKTKIGVRFLAAIENEEFHVLPGGIFSRGFVRAFAEQVGLDPESAVADFERKSNYREPPVMDIRVSTAPPEKNNRKLFLPVAIGLLVLVIAGFYFFRNYQAAAVVPPKPVAAIPQPPPPPPPAPVAEPIVVPTSAPITAEAAPEPAKEALILDVSSRETTWVKVVADGAAVNPGENLAPGIIRRYTANTSIRVVVGNAGGVIIKVNDREIRPLGKPGQVREVIITPENLKDLIG